jgi:hypothetical protein
MPAQNRIGLNHLDRTKQARPESNQPNHQRPVAAAQSETRRRPSHCDIPLMTEKQILGRMCDLNTPAANIPSKCRIGIIAHNDAMILPYNANQQPDGIFGKDTAIRSPRPRGQAAPAAG